MTFLENLGLESPNFPGRYNNSEKCVAVMPAFSAVTVTAFSTEWRYDFLIINQQRYSGTSRDIENKTFVIRPNSTNISWFPDAFDSLSGWQLCLDTPPACSDGFPVVPVAGEDCPSSVENLLSCETAALGALCIGDGTCHTRMDIDNCGQADIYRKMRPKSNGSTFPYDPIPVLVGSAPRPSLAESSPTHPQIPPRRPPLTPRPPPDWGRSEDDDGEDVEDGLSILQVTYAVSGVAVVLICILVTMRCSQRKKGHALGVAEPVEQGQGVALPADFPGSWLMATWSSEELKEESNT